MTARTVHGAAKTGNEREALVALRDLLARTLDLGPADRDLAALAARFQDVLKQLRELAEPVEGTPLDELAKQRARSSGPTAITRAGAGR